MTVSGFPPPIEVGAKTAHTSTVIFLHGMADKASNWVHLAHKFHADEIWQHTKFVFPNAPLRGVTLWDSKGVTMPAWFDIPTWNDIAPGKHDEDGLRSSRKYLLSLIEREEREHGINPSQICIGGFSQGGCVALFTGVLSTFRLCAVFGLSTYLPMVDNVKLLHGKLQPSTSVAATTPFFMGHGNGDPKVKLHWGQRTANSIESMGIPIRFEIYSGMFHQTCEKEIEDLKIFLAQALRIAQKSS